jgi:hypothetical protein
VSDHLLSMHAHIPLAHKGTGPGSSSASRCPSLLRLSHTAQPRLRSEHESVQRGLGQRRRGPPPPRLRPAHAHAPCRPGSRISRSSRLRRWPRTKSSRSTTIPEPDPRKARARTLTRKTGTISSAIARAAIVKDTANAEVGCLFIEYDIPSVDLDELAAIRSDACVHRCKCQHFVSELSGSGRVEIPQMSREAKAFRTLRSHSVPALNKHELPEGETVGAYVRRVIWRERGVSI